MKEFIDKLIARLENHIEYCESCHEEFKNAQMSFTYEVQINAYKNAIEIVNQLAEEYKPKTNFDYCCESVENMAQIIDIAKIGWTKEQIIEWLQSEAE